MYIIYTSVPLMFPPKLKKILETLGAFGNIRGIWKQYGHNAPKMEILGHTGVQYMA